VLAQYIVLYRISRY